MKNRGLHGIIVMLLAVLLAATPAAAFVAWEFTAPVAQNTKTTSYAWTLGAEFTVQNSSITVTQLGFFDYLGDGLVDSHIVAIWATAAPSTILTSATVPSGTGGNLDGHFRYVATTPVTLTVGTHYRIGAFSPANSDYYTYNPVNPPGLTTDSHVHYNNGASFVSSALVYPSDSDYKTWSYFGPNFKTDPVPVPASLVLLGSGLLGLLGLGYFRKKA